MIQTYLKLLGFAAFIIALQVLVLNHIHILGYATPLLIVYVLAVLPISLSRWAKLLWGFALGLIEDSFLNTPGMMVSTLTLIAMVQPTLLVLVGNQSIDNDDTSHSPSITTLGVLPFMRYALVMVLLQNSVFYLIEAFRVAGFTDALINIAGSSILDIVLIWLIESIRAHLQQK